MTILVVVGIRDSAMDAYMRPLVFPHQNVAIREFSDAVNRNDPENAMYQHPEDYELHKLGLWDDRTGEYEALKSPELLVRGKDVGKPA